MAAGWNIFRVLADVSHLLSKIILIYSIHRNRSAEGVSWITQILYMIVFVSRYTDLYHESHAWNFFFKVFYLLSSAYTISIMRWMYPRTREREIAWKMGAAVLGGSLVLSPFAMMIFEDKAWWGWLTWLWDFSQILESVAVLPQLLLLRQTTIPTVITSFYILFLGSYRALYLLNWLVRELDVNDRAPNAVSVLFGLVQTALYLDFAWVYWTRQRVKLRNGGVVDADDLRRGWLLRRIFHSKRLGFGAAADEGVAGDEESAPGRGVVNRWGARGISVSADGDEGELLGAEGLSDESDEDEGGLGRQESGVLTVGAGDADARMRDPDELAKALDEDEEGEPTLASTQRR